MLFLQNQLKQGLETLKQNQIPHPQKTAEILLLEVLKKYPSSKLPQNLTNTIFYTHPNFILTAQQNKTFANYIQRCIQNEPLPYIFKKAEFYGLEFCLDQNVLIPRPETELIVDQALKYIRQQSKGRTAILDIGTGSGCLAVSLVKKLPAHQYQVFALDVSLPALKIAQKNAKKHQLFSKIKFIQSDLLSYFFHHAKKTLKIFSKVKYIIFLANLPYISKEEYKNLPQSVKNFEPKQALIAGQDGLQYYYKFFKQLKLLNKKLIQNFPKKNKAKIFTLIEIAPSQALKLKKIIQKFLPTAKIEICKDYARKKRIIKIKSN